MQRPVDVVRRREFDADLVEQARARGIEIVAGEGLAAFQVDAAAGQVTVETTRGRRLTARVLVGADGAGSRVRKAVSLEARPPLRLFQAEIPTPPALAGEVAGRMIYDFSLMARGLRGYLWLFPAPGRPAERRRDAHAVREEVRRRDRGAAARGAGRLGRHAAGRRARLAGLAVPLGRADRGAAPGLRRRRRRHRRADGRGDRRRSRARAAGRRGDRPRAGVGRLSLRRVRARRCRAPSSGASWRWTRGWRRCCTRRGPRISGSR